MANRTACMEARIRLLNLPQGDRLAAMAAAHRRAVSRLKALHRDEYEDELYNPSEVARWP